MKIDPTRPSEPRTVALDGADDRGVALSSGVYLLRMEASGRIRSSRVVLVR